MTDNASDKVKVPHIVLAMELMTEALAKIGISKEKTASTGSSGTYKFRGIDDIRNAVAPLQKHCGLLIYPSMTHREEKERQKKDGGFALHVKVKVDMHFRSTHDGSEIVTQWENEAIDFQDKATKKAVSNCYTTAIINTFNIPTEGEEDPDKEKAELKATRRGVFDSPDLRMTYSNNCQLAFENATSALNLKEIEGFYHEKLILMANSEDEGDRIEATKCRELYGRRLKEMSAPPARATVDAAVKAGQP